MTNKVIICYIGVVKVIHNEAGVKSLLNSPSLILNESKLLSNTISTILRDKKLCSASLSLVAFLQFKFN